MLRTPMLPAPKLSALTGAEVYVKYENLQVTNSFKDRGALVACVAERSRAQAWRHYHVSRQPRPGGGLSPARLGIPATIVMPVTTPFVKVAATRMHGAEVVLHGESVAEAQARCEQIQVKRNLVLVHPTTTLASSPGRGTITLEVLVVVPDLDVLVFPVGGGGLIAGNAIAAHAKNPAIEVVGAEAALYPSVWNALRGEDRPIGGPTLAEGIAVKNVGKLTLPIIRELVAEIILVDEAHLERAVNAYLTLQKTMAEGAGAAGLAAMLAKRGFTGKKVGLVLCGEISTRASLPPSWCVNLNAIAYRVVRLTIPDRPGCRRNCSALASSAPFSRRSSPAVSGCAGEGAKLDVTIDCDGAHAEEIMAAFSADGYLPVRIEPGAAVSEALAQAADCAGGVFCSSCASVLSLT